jgi:hypothetical protein
MSYTIHDLNNDTIALNARLREMRQLKMDESLEEMAKIWTTLSPSQKEGLIQEATRASQLNQAIAHLPAIKMGQ